MILMVAYWYLRSSFFLIKKLKSEKIYQVFT